MAAISRDEVKQIVQECRTGVDAELRELHDKILDHAWTESRARQVAEQASDLAVKKITDNFYMSVGKKTVVTLGATVVALVIVFKDHITSWLTRG